MSDELIGKNIGGYETLRLIGQGGMATVYLARQQSMNRQVALKVLPRQFLSDDTYMQRFTREVEIVSRLEHRNIVPVYDYGEYEGMPYIVMRYMPAGSVDDLLLNGAQPEDKILDIFSQIAPALDYAHSKGVLHRDLKPSNILLDDDGGAYITDFGIARISGEQTSAITTQGVVGTPSYMSPEQAQGKPLDGRSDVYALGVMLFEMATGRRPFLSDTPYSVAVMQVTTLPPMPRSINPKLTSALESVILKSLKKPPDERYQTAIDLLNNLRLAIEYPESAHDTARNLSAPPADPNPAPVQNPAPTPNPAPLPPLISPPPYSATRGGSQVMPPYATGPQRSIPPGSLTKRKRRGSPLLSILIGGTLGCGLLAVLLVVGFFALTALGIFGGVSSSEPPTRSPDSEAVIAPATFAPDEGTAPTLDPTSETARQTLVARNERNDATQTAVSAATAAAPTRTPGIDPIGVRGTPTLRPGLRDISGTLLFADRRANFDTRSFEIVRLDLDRWEETQPTFDNSDNNYPTSSPDGRWIAFQSDRDGDNEIYLVNPVGGQLARLTDNDHDDILPSWSPDGEWVVYSSDVRGDGTHDLYRVRLDGSENQLVYTNDQRKTHARYSPDGRYLVFTMGTDPLDSRTWEIARLELATNEVITLTDNATRDASPVFHPDGETILYVTYDGDDNDLAVMDIDGRNNRILFDSGGNDWAASYSPDGAFIVFTSNVNGDDELYLMTASGDIVQQITATGGHYASWMPSPTAN